MASSGCWKCLTRPSLSATSPLTRSTLPSLLSGTTASFSTTAAVAKNPNAVKKGGGGTPPARGTKTLRIKKKVPAKPTGKPPAPGERKAMRKRIVLSNTNALEVPGLVDLNDQMLLDESLIGRVVGIPGEVVDQLRTVEAFKITQAWGLFRRPAFLIRKESVEVAKLLEQSVEKKSTTRLIFDGARGTGKSMMLLHAITSAFLKGWVVINIPEAQELTTAVTDYAPIDGTNPILYSQNTYTASLLGQISKSNAKILSDLEVTQQHNLPIPIPPKTTLARLAELGARDPEIAWPIFKALWSELMAPGRPPVLMAIDSLGHVMKDSDYRNPEFELIHSHDLALINHFVHYFSGVAQLPNGGAFIGSTSRSHAPVSKSVELVIGQKADLQDGKQTRAKDPFTKYDDRVLNSMQKADLIRLQGLTKDEARGLMEYWAASGVLRSRVDEKTVTEKWALSGHGVVGEIERGALRMRI
ncbi:mitochondrial ribosomal death-associated protein 3-domain-containing protein [Xylogone sp. PMI_703]|nr:mitochondrial ribosomal death-associated protein 3-domain-containing protein [Xylogone sp. PMI_703]